MVGWEWQFFLASSWTQCQAEKAHKGFKHQGFESLFSGAADESTAQEVMMVQAQLAITVQDSCKSSQQKPEEQRLPANQSAQKKPEATVDSKAEAKSNLQVMMSMGTLALTSLKKIRTVSFIQYVGLRGEALYPDSGNPMRQSSNALYQRRCGYRCGAAQKMTSSIKILLRTCPQFVFCIQSSC